MKSDSSARAEHRRMTQEPIPRLLPSLALPVMGSMLFTSLYNLADTYFIAGLGADAISAVGLLFPAAALIQAAGFTLGMGGGSLISLQLGQKQQQKASQIASASFLCSILCGLLIASGLFWQEPLLRFLGATDASLPFAADYSFFLLLSAPFSTGSLCLSHLLRAEGKTFHVLIAVTLSSLLGILLDALLPSVLGIRGISLSTLLSQAFTLILLLSAFCTGKTIVRLTPSLRGLRRLPAVFASGAPSLLRQGLAALSSLLLNRRAVLYGDAAVAAMSIAGRIFLLPFTLMLGYGQGLQPVIGYNYAQHNTARIRSSARFCLWTGTAALALLGGLLFWQAPQLVRLFAADDTVCSIASVALRAGALTLPLLPACTIVNLGFQAVKRPWTASFLAAARQGFFFVPLILYLPGLWGVQTAQAMADAATFILSVPFLIYFLHKAVDKKEAKV